MKKNFSDKSGIPVPRWGRGIFVLAGLVLLLVSASAGFAAADECNIPVISDGEIEAVEALSVAVQQEEQEITVVMESVLETPVDEVCISSAYGPRWGRMHNGTDFALSSGKNIYAAESGTVSYAGYCGGYGRLVKIEHDNGMQTCYAHCSEILVSQGQYVERGDVIALVGSTGNSTGPHLHFEVVENGSSVDPVTVLNIE